jgi:ElaB/YqjD/DUF883 family membrane-anchored ribosome-binding protein
MESDSRKQANDGEALESASNRASAAAGRISELGHEAMDKVTSTARGAAQGIVAHSEQWRARGDEMTGEVRDYVRERPLVSLAMAAAVGFVVYRVVDGGPERSRYIPPSWKRGYGGSGYSRDRVRATADGMAERGHQALDKVAATARDTAERIRERGAEWLGHPEEVAEQVGDYVRERAMMSLAIAATMGTMLYLLFGGGQERDTSWHRG